MKIQYIAIIFALTLTGCSTIKNENVKDGTIIETPKPEVETMVVKSKNGIPIKKTIRRDDPDKDLYIQLETEKLDSQKYALTENCKGKLSIQVEKSFNKSDLNADSSISFFLTSEWKYESDSQKSAVAYIIYSYDDDFNIVNRETNILDEEHNPLENLTEEDIQELLEEYKPFLTE